MAWTKSQLSKLVAMGLAEESFEHSIEGHFNVSAMRRLALADKREPVYFPLEDAVVEELKKQYDWEEARVQELMAAATGEPEPGCMVMYPDGHTLPIDGVHRLIAYHRLGREDMPFWTFTPDEIIRPDFSKVVSLADWGRFDLVDGKPVPRPT